MVAARRRRRGPGTRGAAGARAATARPAEAQSPASRSIPGTRRFGWSRKGPARQGAGTRIGAVPGPHWAPTSGRPRLFPAARPFPSHAWKGEPGARRAFLDPLSLESPCVCFSVEIWEQSSDCKIGGLSKMYNSEALNVAITRCFYLCNITSPTHTKKAAFLTAV